MSDLIPTQVDMTPPTHYKPEGLTVEVVKLLEFLSIVGETVPRNLFRELSIELLSKDSPVIDKATYRQAEAQLLEVRNVELDECGDKITIFSFLQQEIFETVDDAKRKRFYDAAVRRTWSLWPAALPKPSMESQLPAPKAYNQRLSTDRWSECEDIFPTIERLYNLFPLIPDLSHETKILSAKLLMEGLWYKKERGYLTKYVPEWTCVARILNGVHYPEKDAALADYHFCYGSVEMDSNKFAASRDHKEQSFKLVDGLCKSLGKEDARLAIAYAEMGIARIQDREYEAGVADIDKSIRIMKNLGGYIPHSREANMSYGLMALGKLDECEKLLQESLQARVAALGKTDISSVRTGLLFNALATLKSLRGDEKEARLLYEKAWRQMGSAAGAKDSQAARAGHKLAECYLRAGETESASKLIEDVLQAWAVDVYANDAPNARSLFLKSEILVKMGNKDAAAGPRAIAAGILKTITGKERDADSLTLADFDEVVGFWAR